MPAKRPNKSEALSAAVNALDEYREELDFERRLPIAATLVNELRRSVAGLRLSDTMLRIDSVKPSADPWGPWLAQLVATGPGREALAIGLGYDALSRAGFATDRLVAIARVLPKATPPARADRYLRRVSAAYLFGFDHEAIAMARGVVEVIVEELIAPAPSTSLLGASIRKLKDAGTITPTQASAMFFINEQAKEVLHDEVGQHPLDALGCLTRLVALLDGLHPAGQ
ncbi:MAG: hypothetical protein ABJB33_08570 [Gemmatimonadota bacterium]